MESSSLRGWVGDFFNYFFLSCFVFPFVATNRKGESAAFLEIPC